MPVDTGIYNNIQAPPNPFDTVGKYVGLSNELQHNQLLQQQVRGNVETAQAIKEATDPNTGEVNNNQLMNIIAHDPRFPNARINALRISQEANAANPLTQYMGQNGQGQPTPMMSTQSQVRSMGNPAQQAQPVDQGKIDKLHKHLDTIQGALQDLANKPDLQQGDMIDSVVDTVAHPDTDFHATDGAKFLSTLPSGQGGTPPNSQQLQQFVGSKLQQVNQNKAALSAKYPSSDQLAHARGTAGQMAGATPQGQQIAMNDLPPPGQGGNSPQLQPQGQPPQSQPSQQEQQPPQSQASPGVATGAPMGYAEAQSHGTGEYQKTIDDANSVPQTQAVLQKILNLSKAGAPTGTKLSGIYQWLAQRGLAPTGVEDATAQSQEIKKYMENAALAAGMPDSDARLATLHEANPNPDQLAATIQKLVPFLEAANKGKLVKANYYRQTAGSNLGTNPQQVQSAQTNWNNTFDPRVLEYNSLSPEDKKEYVKDLPQADAQALVTKRKAMREQGIIQ
jgi:hypothetical protein